MRLGFIGLGRMGRPMARHLVAKGFCVAGCDPQPEARARAEALGVAIAPSPRDLAARRPVAIAVAAALAVGWFVAETGTNTLSVASDGAVPACQLVPVAQAVLVVPVHRCVIPTGRTRNCWLPADLTPVAAACRA